MLLYIAIIIKKVVGNIMEKLMIVESPNKVKTIKKYLDDSYEVISSVGHILKMSTRIENQ